MTEEDKGTNNADGNGKVVGSLHRRRVFFHLTATRKVLSLCAWLSMKRLAFLIHTVRGAYCAMSSVVE